MSLEAQDNPFPSVLFAEHVDPSNPGAGTQRLFIDTDHILKLIDSAGTVSSLSAGAIANPLATDSLWDAAGDLVQGSGANTAAKLSAGTAGKVLTSNGAAAALTWETPSASGAMATDALWDAAGDLAVGSGANTGAKLTIGNAGGVLARINGAVAWNASTSFPTATTGDRFFRTDLGMEFYYDGTRWVSTQLFSIINSLGMNTTATAYVPMSVTTSPAFFLPGPDKLGGSDIWLVSSRLTFYLAAGTALSGSHKWVVTTGKVTSANVNTVVATHNIDSGASTTWREDSQAIGALMNNGTTHYTIYLTATKTGTPGNLYPELLLTYRIVAT